MKYQSLWIFTALVSTWLSASGHATAQDDSVLAKTVAWFTGDPAVTEGPRNYAEHTCCPDGTCGCCSQCCCQSNVFGSVELLMWWAKGSSLPPLVSDGPLGPPANGNVLFGNQLGGGRMQTGARLVGGLWLDPEHNTAVGGRFFWLGGDATRFTAIADGTNFLGRPFFDVLQNAPAVVVIGAPGVATGTVNAHYTTSNVLGAEAFTEIMMQQDVRRRVDLVMGYQFFRVDDWLQVDSTTQAPIVAPAVNISITDRFSAHNQFHGGELGLRGRMARGQWSLDVLGAVAVGNMNEQVTITGVTDVAGIVNPGGVLAQPSNIGVYTRNRLAAVPQLTANLKYHLTPALSTHIGYNMIWFSNIATSGEQVDTAVNTIQIGGGPPVGQPAFVFRDRDYWLQGINFGLNLDY